MDVPLSLQLATASLPMDNGTLQSHESEFFAGVSTCPTFC